MSQQKLFSKPNQLHPIKVNPPRSSQSPIPPSLVINPVSMTPIFESPLPKDHLVLASPSVSPVSVNSMSSMSLVASPGHSISTVNVRESHSSDGRSDGREPHSSDALHSHGHSDGLDSHGQDLHGRESDAQDSVQEYHEEEFRHVDMGQWIQMAVKVKQASDNVHHQAQELYQEREDLIVIKAKLETEVARLNDLQRALNLSKDKAQSSANSLSKEKESLKGKLNEATAKINTMVQTKKELEVKIASLEEQLNSNQESRLDKMEMELTGTVQKEVSTLAETLSLMHSEMTVFAGSATSNDDAQRLKLGELTEKLISFETLIREEFNTKERDLIDCLDRVLAENRELDTQLSGLYSETARKSEEYHVQLTETKESLAISKSELIVLGKNLEVEQAKVVSLEMNLDQSMEKSQSLEIELNGLKQTLVELQAAFDKAIQDADTFKTLSETEKATQANTIETLSGDFAAKMNSFNTFKADFESRIENHIQANRALEGTIKDLQGNARASENYQGDMNIKYEKLFQDYSNLMTKMAKEESAFELREKITRDLEANVERLLADLDLLKDERAFLFKKFQDLTQEVEELKNQPEESCQECVDHLETIKDLQNRENQSPNDDLKAFKALEEEKNQMELAFQEQVKTMEAKLTTSEAEFHNFKSQSSTQLAQLETTCQSKDDELSSLREKVSNFEKMYNDERIQHQNDLLQNNNRIKELEVDLARAESMATPVASRLLSLSQIQHSIDDQEMEPTDTHLQQFIETEKFVNVVETKKPPLGLGKRAADSDDRYGKKANKTPLAVQPLNESIRKPRVTTAVYKRNRTPPLTNKRGSRQKPASDDIFNSVL